MIFTQVTILKETKIKMPNKSEKVVNENIVLPAESQRISQTRIDENSLQGLSKKYRWELDNIGEIEQLIFMYFLDEKGNKLKVTTWERNPQNNKMVLEGVAANGI